MWMTPVHENLKTEEEPNAKNETTKTEEAEEAEGTKANEEDATSVLEATKDEKRLLETYRSVF